MNKLTPEMISLYKKALEKSEKVLASQVEDLKKVPDMGSDVDAFDEETDEAEAFSNQMGMGESLKDRLARVREALRKIEEGKYGICEKCDTPIETEILDIDPESEYCKACKKLLEKKS